MGADLARARSGKPTRTGMGAAKLEHFATKPIAGGGGGKGGGYRGPQPFPPPKGGGGKDKTKRKPKSGSRGGY